MPPKKKVEEEPKPKKPRRPAATLEGRESQLVGYAVDLAEQQLLAGTASSQTISHFLKLSSTREQLEQERLRQENLLLEAKIAAIESQGRMEALYADALDAMKGYQGRDEVEEYES